MEMIESFRALRNYCECEDFKGWDPYDGLNSRLFRVIPFLKQSALCRLMMIQGFKRSPVNLRRLAMVPKDYNAKGIGLFLQGYCNLYKLIQINPTLTSLFGSREELSAHIRYLAELLLSLRSSDYSGACWGYNFDWQARRLFLFPKNTPTVVATSFCATALLEAAELFGNTQWRDIALSSARFVINDLHRTRHRNGILFSYSPLQGNDTVFNASLLAARLLSYCYHYVPNTEYADLARLTVLACCNSQQESGAWAYGLLPVQSWCDSFHTGYNLDGIAAYEEMTGDRSFHTVLEKGFEFYVSHFFETDGCPKYYADRKWPIDIHCPAQLPVTLARLNKWSQYKLQADCVMKWAIKHMQDKRGYFYYQMKPWGSSRIPYMRWSNAFMFYAMSYYFLNVFRDNQ